MDPSQLLIEIFGGVLVGLSLGLVGAGGAIFSVPIFAMLLGHPTQTAILEALAVTGLIAFAGALGAARAHRIEYRMGVAFMLPGMAGAWVGGPIGKWLSDPVQAGLFSLVALAAAVRMFTVTDAAADAREVHAARPGLPKIVIAGFAIGVLTAVIGVGGGFLLIPAFVLIARLDMSRAVGTSLMVIATNAAIALTSNAIYSHEAFELVAWPAIAIVAVCGVVGSVFGARLGARIPQKWLRRSFAAVLVAVAGLFALESTGVTRLQEPRSAPESAAEDATPQEPSAAGTSPDRG